MPVATSNANSIESKSSFTCLRKNHVDSPVRSTDTTCLSDCRASRFERVLQLLFSQSVADGLRFFLNRNEFDMIITEDYRAAVIFGLLTRLFGGRSRHIVKELYLAEDTLTIRWKRTLFRVALKRADRIIVNATSERAAYAAFLNLSLERVVFLPWPANIPIRLESQLQDQGYIFAAGRSMRDWQTLFAAATLLPTPFVVVASHQDVASLTIPSNVTVYCDIGREQYLQLLAGAHIVVLPLTKTLRSTGQAVALEAMAMRKPLLCADTPGISDYVTDEENGLLYKAEDPTTLRCQIQRLLLSPELRSQLVRTAVDRIEKVFNKNHYREALRDIMSFLVTQPRA